MNVTLCPTYDGFAVLLTLVVVPVVDAVPKFATVVWPATTVNVIVPNTPEGPAICAVYVPGGRYWKYVPSAFEAHVPHKPEMLMIGFASAVPFTVAVPVTRPAVEAKSTRSVLVDPPTTVPETLANFPAATAQLF
jgi:hypothetical protein